jgi:predicted DNA-binding transcriptional regulator AlpA
MTFEVLEKRRRGRSRGERLANMLVESAAFVPVEHQSVTDPLLDDRDLEQITKIPRSSWKMMRCHPERYGQGPRYVKIGRLVRYRWSAYCEWRDALVSRQSTGEFVQKQSA